MKNKKLWLKVVSIILSIALIISCVPLMVSADSSKIHFGIISDIHYLAPSLRGGDNEDWLEFQKNKQKEYTLSDSLLENALDGVLRNAVENGENYVLIPGDLTKDGELESHMALAERLEKFEAETGIPVFVIPGNHDINNSKASTYENGHGEETEKTSPEQFREIYADLGFDMADSFFVPDEGKKGGMLSYAVTLGGYRLIAVDSCIYSNDNGAENNEHETSGQLADGLLDWIVEECEKADDSGLTVIGMQHHNLIPHMDIEEATLAPFVVNDWLKVAETYADAGMHYVFTGHLHSNDTVSHVNDNGETVYDILTPTLTGFPNQYKIVDFTSDGETTKMEMQTLDIDKYQPVVDDFGKIYEAPFKFTHSFGMTFGENGIEDYIMGALTNLVDDVFVDIQNEGGLLNYLKLHNLDLEQIIIDALGTNGLEIGSVEILTVSSNIMNFIEDLAAQIDEAYINNPEETLAKVEVLIHKLLSYEISEYPAEPLNEYIGSTHEGGATLADLATVVFYNYYGGNEDVSDIEFINDVLNRLDSGELAEEIFNLLREVLITDLVQNEILATLDFNPGELFPEGNIFRILGLVLQGSVEALLGGNNSFINLVNSVLSIPVIPEEYSSVDAIIDHLMGEYITQSQYEAWGFTLKWMLSSLIFDNSPDEFSDNTATITYSGPVEVEATQDNYRLPSHIAVSLGEDSSSEVSITWLTKYSVTGTDIEILPYSANPDFKGKPSTGSGIDTTYESVDKAYPGADIGLLVTILPYEIEYIKHTVRLTGLEPGKKYSYRVGDAELGWWSETGTITTAGGEDEAFTFFYLTDPQAQRKDQYARFGEVIDTAYELYPDSRFVVSAGDQVDAGGNIKHWNYFLNSTDSLLDLPLMPTTGNHEEKGAVITENFVLPNVPEQDLETGVYYSYDYNSVHFTVLNTNDTEDDKLGQAQLDWMINDIRTSDAKWKIVVLHKAPYSNGSHYDDGDVEGIRTQLSALLPYLGVDLVLQGHDHVYLRTDVLNGNVVMPTRTGTKTYNGQDYTVKYDPNGTIYSICGTSGVKVYHAKNPAATDEKFPRAEALYDVENSMFSAITVDGDSLYFNAYEVTDGEAEKIDSFAIEKTDYESPSDKVGIDAVDELIIRFFSAFNVTLAWKPLNFLFGIFNNVLKLIYRIV